MSFAFVGCMPGGPQRIEARDYEPLPWRVLNLSTEEREWDLAIQFWNRARRFRRRVERIAGWRGISFARWQVLEATERLIREKGDAVSQKEVAQRTELPSSSVSELTRALSLGGLVDVAPDAWGVSDRIWMTQKGERLLSALRLELAEVVRSVATAE
jgi:DNA-binding MarR family transcriptional regulator